MRRLVFIISLIFALTTSEKVSTSYASEPLKQCKNYEITVEVKNLIKNRENQISSIITELDGELVEIFLPKDKIFQKELLETLLVGKIVKFEVTLDTPWFGDALNGGIISEQDVKYLKLRTYHAKNILEIKPNP